MKFNWPGMVIGLSEIVDGLGRFFSLGNLHLNLAFKTTAWAARRRLRE
jgi:hypothetical protein